MSAQSGSELLPEVYICVLEGTENSVMDTNLSTYNDDFVGKFWSLLRNKSGFWSNLFGL